MKAAEPHLRFREARERLSLSLDEVAILSGIPKAGMWDIESFEGDLTNSYSLRHIQKFCEVLNIRPVELFTDDMVESVISADELVRLIRAECSSRSITSEQFENVVGWRLSACMEPSERLLEDMTVDGMQWLCRELHIDWRRVLLSL